MGGETHGGILILDRTGLGVGPELPGVPYGPFTRYPTEPPSSSVWQSLAARKVRAPFFLTRMREWREQGGKQMWLWSLRGNGWVIDQELYLGHDESEMPPAEKGLVESVPKTRQVRSLFQLGSTP
jgi:hypothetical protein